LKLGLFAFVLLGCAAAATTAQPPAEWERRKLADGIEVYVSPDAGPEARRAVDHMQSEMRQRYLGAP